MTVPNAITDLSTNAASNSPAGSDAIGTTLDDFLRAHASFIASLYATKQPLDASLTALSGVTVAADKMLYAKGADDYTVTGLTAPARSVLDDANITAMQTTLLLLPGTHVQAYSANLAEYAAVNPTASGLALLDDADNSAQRTTLGLGTAAVKNTGASGDAVPLCNVANTWAETQTFNKAAGFDAEISPSATTGAITIDWRDGNRCKFTPTGNCTLSFTAPGIRGKLTLIVTSGATPYTITQPGSAVAMGDTPATAANKDTIYQYDWDGSEYRWMGVTEK